MDRSWIGWCALSIVGMGVGGVFQKLGIKTWDAPGRLAALEGCVAFILMALFALVFQKAPDVPSSQALKGAGWAAAAGVCSTVAVLGALMALRTGQVSLVSPLLSTYIVLAAFFGWWLLNEPLKVVHAVGIGLVLLGAVLLTR